MSLSRYSAQASPSMPCTPMRRLVVIDAASRLATRFLERRADRTVSLPADVTPADVEAFRVGSGSAAFQRIATHLTEKQQN